MKHQFKLGDYRPIYLWAGPGTIRMNKVKFMNYPVDEAAHREAQGEKAAKLVVEDLKCNWVHLMYDWGFPPEIELEDWEDFRIAAENYHQAGSPVFAYIQTSNCVYQGSFKDKDWYARNPKGQKIYYYSGRYMVDWTHPEWIAHLKDLIKGALVRGADGIFFDNLWYGQMPNPLMGAWLGGAGCYCKRCCSLYFEETKAEIPTKIFPEREAVAHYIRWRADRVTQTIRELAEYVHQLKPDAPISANDFDVVTHNAYLVWGIDVEALSTVQDVVMVENFSLPRLEVSTKKRLVNNALTIRNTRVLVRDHAHLSVLSYEHGIGFDPVYPPRRHQRGIAEAAACGASMTIKGTEYNDGQQMTMLTKPEYHAQHAAIGAYHRWLEAHQTLYQDRENLAPVGLAYPEEDLWRHWEELSGIYYGASQALTWAGIPWRVIREGDSLEGLSLLLTFTPSTQQQFSGQGSCKHVHIPDLPGWAWEKSSPVAKGGVMHDLVESAGLFLLRSYHASKMARRIMDKLNMAKLVLQSPIFDLPGQERVNVLMAVLPDAVFPRVEAEQPVLIETWGQGMQRQVHLMNYADEQQQVTVHFATPVRAKVISPDTPGILTHQGKQFAFILDIYSILLLE